MSSDIRILLVDDFEVNQKIVRQHLHKGGYTVDLAANGQQAVEAFMQNRYDLILMDIDMPVMNGYDAANSIRKIEQNLPQTGGVGHATTGPIPIIAMSGNAAADEDGRSCLPGMDDCICKPFQRAELLQLVKKWIAGPQNTTIREEATGACLPPCESPRDPEAPLDLTQALQEFMGNTDVLIDVLDSFVANGRECIQSAREAMHANDYKQVQSLAHKLGGGAANLTARKLADDAFALENAVQDEEINSFQPLLQKFEQEFSRFETYLRQNAMSSSIEE